MCGTTHFSIMGNKNFFKQYSVIGIHCQKSKPWTNQMIYQRPGQNLLTIDSRGISSVQFSRSVVSDSLWPHESQHTRPPCPSLTPGAHSDSCPSSPWSPCSHLILGHPLLLLPPIPPSIRVFSKESTLLMRWPKYCSVSFSIIPSEEIPGLISSRMDWLDLWQSLPLNR